MFLKVIDLDAMFDFDFAIDDESSTADINDFRVMLSDHSSIQCLVEDLQ